MSVLGKVARLSLIGATASLVLAGSAFGSLNPGATWLRPAGAPPYELAPIPAGYTLVTNDAVANTGPLSGTTYSRVYKNNVDNTLLFSYQVGTSILEGGFASELPIESANVGGTSWTGVTITRAGADPVGSSGATDPAPEWMDGSPATMSRSTLASPVAGQSPKWTFFDGDFGTVIGFNNLSAEVWFATNATEKTKAFIGYLGEGATGMAEVWVPVYVPEPASLVLIGLATGGMAFFRRRRTA